MERAVEPSSPRLLRNSGSRSIAVRIRSAHVPRPLSPPCPGLAPAPTRRRRSLRKTPFLAPLEKLPRSSYSERPAGRRAIRQRSWGSPWVGCLRRCCSCRRRSVRPPRVPQRSTWAGVRARDPRGNGPLRFPKRRQVRRPRKKSFPAETFSSHPSSCRTSIP